MGSPAVSSLASNEISVISRALGSLFWAHRAQHSFSLFWQWLEAAWFLPQFPTALGRFMRCASPPPKEKTVYNQSLFWAPRNKQFALDPSSGTSHQRTLRGKPRRAFGRLSCSRFNGTSALSIIIRSHFGSSSISLM